MVVGGAVLVVSVTAGAYFLTRDGSLARTSNVDSVSSKGTTSAKGMTNAHTLTDQWSKIESEMRSSGKSEKDIALAKSDYFSIIGSTLVTSIQLDSTLTEAEKKAKLLEVSNLIPKGAVTSTNNDCPYVEEKLPLQEMFNGASVRFSKPMLYLEWNDTREKGCTPTRAGAKYLLESSKSWNSLIFDKSKIKEISIDPNTVFTVEGRISVTRGGLMNDKREYYIFRDINGVVAVPSYSIFDIDLLPAESGSNLYRGGKYVGHVVTDMKTQIIWIKEEGVPIEVLRANEFKRSVELDNPISKKDEYLRRVMFAVDENKFKNFTVSESIALGNAENIYEIKNGRIVNDYGGDVEIFHEGAEVSVTFKSIPRGDACYQLYFINDPSILGFSETYIDGVLEAYPEMSSKVMQEFKDKVCYSNKATMDIKFKGAITKIKEQAVFTHGIETSPYSR